MSRFHEIRPYLNEQELDLEVRELYDYRAGPVWTAFLEIDCQKVLLKRRKQKAYLARYAREAWRSWLTRPVRELDLMTYEINEIIKEENGPKDR